MALQGVKPRPCSGPNSVGEHWLYTETQAPAVVLHWREWVAWMPLAVYTQANVIEAELFIGWLFWRLRTTGERYNTKQHAGRE